MKIESFEFDILNVRYNVFCFWNVFIGTFEMPESHCDWISVIIDLHNLENMTIGVITKLTEKLLIDCVVFFNPLSAKPFLRKKVEEKSFSPVQILTL